MFDYAFVLRKMSASCARRYFLTGEIFDAERAKESGLIHEVVAVEQLDLKVQEIVEQLLANGPIAVGQAKKLVGEINRRDTQDGLEYALNEICRLRVSKEGQEGLSAFIDKRKPSWQ